MCQEIKELLIYQYTPSQPQKKTDNYSSLDPVKDPANLQVFTIYILYSIDLVKSTL